MLPASVPAKPIDPAPRVGSPPTTELLRVAALRCERGERPLFTDLSFTLHTGDIVWLRGRNGRGKTTLLRALAGLSAPAAGEIVVSGQAQTLGGAAARRRVLHLGHANALKEDLSVAESLRFFCRLQGASPSDAQLDAALARVGLPGMGPRAIRTLSQGQRRRVALARLALALSLPDAEVGTAILWLLDEPFDALDDDGVLRLAALMASHADAGGAVLFTSHLAAPALDGRLRELGLEAPPETEAGGAAPRRANAEETAPPSQAPAAP